MDNGSKHHLPSAPDHRHLYVCILKIQVKNATQIVDPYITVSLKGKRQNSILPAMTSIIGYRGY